jgi:hypothetical protein
MLGMLGMLCHAMPCHAMPAPSSCVSGTALQASAPTLACSSTVPTLPRCPRYPYHTMAIERPRGLNLPSKRRRWFPGSS